VGDVGKTGGKEAIRAKGLFKELAAEKYMLMFLFMLLEYQY
jgi:hypothetical protein